MKINHSPLHFYNKIKTLNWSSRLFLTLRWKMTPFSQMARDIPENSRILDLGCGHGLFALFLANQSPGRKIFGIDHDAGRIATANAAANSLPSVQFAKVSLSDMAEGHAPPDSGWLGSTSFDVISIIDVLHYFPHQQQESLLRLCSSWLSPDGILLFREVDPQSGPTSRVTQAYEKLSTTLGITRSNEKSELFIRQVDDWINLLDRCGYEAQHQACTHPLFSDVLFTARKKRNLEK